MSYPHLTLSLLAERLAICRLSAADAIPAWSLQGGFTSTTRTGAELSVVCAEDVVPADVRREAGWRCLMVGGPLDFALTGVLAALAEPLAREGISIFAISTFDTDYVLVKDADLPRALAALASAGHVVAQ